MLTYVLNQKTRHTTEIVTPTEFKISDERKKEHHRREGAIFE